MRELLPQLNPVIFWMANSMEMLHFLRSNVSRYLGDASLVSYHGDETLANADEELLVGLEEVVMYTFQQTVYHLTKVKEKEQIISLSHVASVLPSLPPQIHFTFTLPSFLVILLTVVCVLPGSLRRSSCHPRHQPIPI
jgi:hypothetical protein